MQFQFAGTIFKYWRILSDKRSKNALFPHFPPPAYLNYLFFDGEMSNMYGGFPPRLTSAQMSQEAREDGTMKSHERLSQEVVADEPGYYYIYPP
ncbi:hypothetical protein ACFOUP_16315, partial [Belliella kenyensis]